MSINKKLLLIIFSLLIFSNLSILKANEEKINLDDEELPAIDPFQGNSNISTSQNEQTDESKKYPIIGILSKALIGALQLKQCDLGFIMLIFLGTL